MDCADELREPKRSATLEKDVGSLKNAIFRPVSRIIFSIIALAFLSLPDVEGAKAQGLRDQCRAGKIGACRQLCNRGGRRACRKIRRLERGGRRGARRNRRRQRERNVVIAPVVVNRAFNKARPVTIVIPGAGGANRTNFLMRNLGSFRSAGLQPIVTTSGRNAAKLAKKYNSSGYRVVLVGMSRGSVKAARAVTFGAPLKAIVFVSGNMPKVMKIIGSPQRLPATLVVHHPKDACRLTTPEGARRFVGWAGKGRVQMRWINTPVPSRGRPCTSRHAHGFYGHDGPAVAAITGFLNSR